MAISLTVDISNISDGTQIDAADVTVAFNALKTHLENTLNGIQAAEALRLTAITTPSNPAAGYYKMYMKSDSYAYSLDSTGVEIQMTGIDIVRYQCFT